MDKNLENLYATMDKWLYMPDKVPVDVVIATMTAVHLPCDPIWLMLMGATSGGKSEIIRAVETEDTYLTNKMTAASILPGLKDTESKGRRKPKAMDAESIYLLPKLHDKVLLIPDLSNILNYPDQERAAVFSALQDCYDGGFKADFGSVGRLEAKARFGFVAGVTEVIDNFMTKLAAFGQRFIRVAISYSDFDQMEALSKAGSVAGKEPQMREEIRKAFHAILASTKQRALRYAEIPIEAHISQQLEALCGAMTVLRTGVLTDSRTGNANYAPEHEMGMRVMKELSNLGRCLACLYEHDTVGNDEYAVLARVAHDCVPKLRMKIVEALDEWKTIKEIGYATHYPQNWCYQTVDQLYGLRILDYDEDTNRGRMYRLNDYYGEIFAHAGILSLKTNNG